MKTTLSRKCELHFIVIVWRSKVFFLNFYQICQDEVKYNFQELIKVWFFQQGVL